MNDEKIIVISDLHLWGPEDPLYRALLKFLEEKLSFGDRLFIVGDLFDLYIGDKKVFHDRYFELITKIEALRLKNIEVYYVEGNHDFQLEGVFQSMSHVHLYADAVHYEWDGRKLLFNHGDKLNWKDLLYLGWRLFTRNLATQCLIDILPGKVLAKIGSMMSKASREHHYEANEQVVRLFRNYACDQITNGYDFVILGHSHFLDDMKFRVGNHSGQYINSGFPRKDRKYFELKKGHPYFEMKSWEDLVIPLRPVKPL